MRTFSSPLSSSTDSKVKQTNRVIRIIYLIIFSFICENYNNIINLKDNLNRTPLHYACLMNDETIINILQQANAKKVKIELNFCCCLFDLLDT
jgi:hypothetical protein